MLNEPNGCLIGLMEEINGGYKVFKPYVLTGEQYFAIHDLFLNLNISIEDDLCYGNTFDIFAPILYKKEKWFYDLIKDEDGIGYSDFFGADKELNVYNPKLINKSILKDNHLINEKEIMDISLILEYDFQHNFPLICDGTYKNGVQYCINNRRINKSNYDTLINVKEMHESIKSWFKVDELDFIKTVCDTIIQWITEDKYIYVHVY